MVGNLHLFPDPVHVNVRTRDKRGSRKFCQRGYSSPSKRQLDGADDGPILKALV